MSTEANKTTTTEGDGTAAATTTDAAAAASTTPAATPAANDAAADTSTTDAGKKPLTQADIDRAVKSALKDSATKIAAAEAKAKLSEDERAKAEMDELRNQLRERDARDAVNAEAAKLGVKNPAMLYRLVKDQLEFDDKGNVSNLSDVFDTAKSEYADLFTVEKPNESIDAGKGTGGNAVTLTRAQIDKMTPEQIAANMPAIDAFLATQK